MRVAREDLTRFLRGHRAADHLLRAATLRRLRELSPEASRAQYDALVRSWEAARQPGEPPALDRRAIEARVALRRRLAAGR